MTRLRPRKRDRANQAVTWLATPPTAPPPAGWKTTQKYSQTRHVAHPAQQPFTPAQQPPQSPPQPPLPFTQRAQQPLQPSPAPSPLKTVAKHATTVATPPSWALMPVAVCLEHFRNEATARHAEKRRRCPKHIPVKRSNSANTHSPIPAQHRRPAATISGQHRLSH